MPENLKSSCGLDLARRYYEEYGRPMLQNQFPELIPYLAVGRVGEGSECFGFDDSLSRDHDFGPGFCIWLDEPHWAACRTALTTAYWSLPKQFCGFTRPGKGPFLHRVGPFSIQQFYAHFLGRVGLPNTEEQWFAIPQELLATCSNGIVFEDALGTFTGVRDHLLAYYPEQVRLKKLAAHCALASQAGQYNYPRCIQRGEHSAAIWAISRFLYHYMAAGFLLNRRYMPYGKWAHRSFRQLPLVGKRAASLLDSLSPENPAAISSIETACHLLAAELQRQRLSSSQNTFLLTHGESVQSKVTHPGLKNLPLLSWKAGWQL